MTSVWSVEESVKLIDIVKNYPVLWQTDHKLYGRKGPRDAAMRKVYKDFGETRGKVVFFISVGAQPAYRPIRLRAVRVITRIGTFV